MCVRGPSVISEYFSNPQATSESFDAEGYFKTGDVMTCLSTTRKWYITDRKKELIKVRGFQVPPAEIEGVLLTHPAVLDAAVIGIQIPGDPDVEHPRAYVVTRPGAGAVTEESIREFCKTRLARYKELTGGVRFLEGIPRNATGKALKRILREMAKTESKSATSKL
jgi:acyl-CoA synthetase (AMP-forming)/AMP-acid ligase II